MAENENLSQEGTENNDAIENKGASSEDPKSYSQDEFDKEVKSLEKKYQKELGKYKDYDELKKELAALKKLQLTEQERAIKEAEEKIRNEIEPEKTALKEALEAYLEEELSDIPEDKKDLIPDLPLKEKLAWVKKFKAAGGFNSPKPNNSTNIPPGGTPGSSAPDANKHPLGSKEYDSYRKQKYGLPPLRKHTAFTIN